MIGHAGGAIHAHVAPGTTSQPQRFVLSPYRDPDAMQASGEWLATDAPVEIER